MTKKANCRASLAFYLFIHFPIKGNYGKMTLNKLQHKGVENSIEYLTPLYLWMKNS